MINNKISTKGLRFFLFSLGLILIAGLRPIGIDRDSIGYVSYIKGNSEQMVKLIEPAFIFIRDLNNYIFYGNAQSFFFIFALLSVSLKMLAIKKYSIMPMMSAFIYISYFFILQDMTQIRAAVAIGIFYLSLEDVINKNLKVFLIKILFASLFHYSVLFFIFIYFLRSKKISKFIYLFLPLLGFLFFILNIQANFILFITQFAPSFIASKIYIYFDILQNNPSSNFLAQNIGFSVLMIYSLIVFNLFNMRNSNQYEIIFTKFLSIGLFIFLFFMFIPVFAGRLSQYMFFAIVFIIPITISKFKQKYLLYAIFIVYLILYFFKVSINFLNI